MIYYSISDNEDSTNHPICRLEQINPIITLFRLHDYSGNSAASEADLGISIDLKSAVKELKAVTPEKSKTCVTAFIKRLVTNFQLSRTRNGHFFLK